MTVKLKIADENIGIADGQGWSYDADIEIWEIASPIFDSLDKLGFRKHSYSKGPFQN